MSYSPKTWATGNVIGASDLNNIENGISSCDSRLTPLVGLPMRYVSETGNDSNDGLTANSPLKTIAKAIQLGAREISVAGDIDESVVVTNINGLRFYGDSSNTSSICSTVENSYIFKITNCSDVEFYNIAFGTGGVQVRDVNITNSSVKFIGCKFGDNESASTAYGVRAAGSYLSCEHCSFAGLTTASVYLEDNAGIGNICLASDCRIVGSGIIASGSTVLDIRSGYMNVSGMSAVRVQDSVELVVEDTVFYQCDGGTSSYPATVLVNGNSNRITILNSCAFVDSTNYDIRVASNTTLYLSGNYSNNSAANRVSKASTANVVYLTETKQPTTLNAGSGGVGDSNDDALDLSMFEN